MSSKPLKTKDAINLLKASTKDILSYLRKVIKSKKFNYRTFGTEIEPYLTNVIIEIFKKKSFIKNETDYIEAPHKNYFPDFELKTELPLAIEYKSGNKSQYRKGKWISVKNSENDMGTLGEWLKKIKKFGGENIYYVFIIYNFNDKSKEILDIVIAPFYQLIGLNSDKLLKYREKDGNLRPKNFDTKPSIKSLKQFKELFSKTVVYRSKRIIKRHRLIIEKENKKGANH